MTPDEPLKIGDKVVGAILGDSPVVGYLLCICNPLNYLLAIPKKHWDKSGGSHITHGCIKCGTYGTGMQNGWFVQSDMTKLYWDANLVLEMLDRIK